MQSGLTSSTCAVVRARVRTTAVFVLSGQHATHNHFVIVSVMTEANVLATQSGRSLSVSARALFCFLA
eukprot:226869-Chlamydomonas_euryale.AAC.1